MGQVCWTRAKFNNTWNNNNVTTFIDSSKEFHDCYPFGISLEHIHVCLGNCRTSWIGNIHLSVVIRKRIAINIIHYLLISIKSVTCMVNIISNKRRDWHRWRFHALIRIRLPRSCCSPVVKEIFIWISQSRTTIVHPQHRINMVVLFFR